MKIANNLTFSVRDFRAVHSADINLNGITVVAGINGSGKSTLSKLIYNSVENILHFDGVVRKEIHEEIKVIYRLFQRIHKRLGGFLPDYMDDEGDAPMYWYNVLNSLEDEEDTDGLKECLEYIGFVREVMTYEDAQQSQRISRLASVLHFIDKEEFTIDIALEVLEDRVTQGQNSIVNFNKAMELRSSETFYANLKQEFKDLSPNNLSITELDSSVLSEDEPQVGKLPTLSKAIYLDSPMIVGLDFTGSTKEAYYWETFNDLLNETGSPIDGAADVNELLKETIQGESDKNEDYIYGAFSYKRSDGRRFDLEESATGVRAFSAIQILLNNGVIDEDTLLIIDEPEAHLHPQWIVEYARLIVRMNKQLGVKFFITSHSTDMISALKYINNKEGIKSSLTFYNAEPLQEDPFRFDYCNLERDIEPIFDSFNKSFDKIEQYGTDED